MEKLYIKIKHYMIEDNILAYIGSIIDLTKNEIEIETEKDRCVTVYASRSDIEAVVDRMVFDYSLGGPSLDFNVDPYNIDTFVSCPELNTTLINFRMNLAAIQIESLSEVIAELDSDVSKLTSMMFANKKANPRTSQISLSSLIILESGSGNTTIH